MTVDAPCGKKLHRTRFAPTPSGYLHLGNVFSFALTASFAEQHGANILLRIDDLDRQRAKSAYVEDIFATLDYLGLPWNDGPADEVAFEAVYSQRHRLALYETALMQLRESGLVFACDCSRSTLLHHHPHGVYTGTCRHKGLPLDETGYNWRLDTTGSDLPPKMQHFVVRKKDGYPAYQVASLVDDVHFGIDLIVRGVDLRESTQAQLYLAELLGYQAFQQVKFYHHILLKHPTARKLSKSAGDTSVQYLRKTGKSKVDIYRMIGELVGAPRVITSWEDMLPADYLIT